MAIIYTDDSSKNINLYSSTAHTVAFGIGSNLGNRLNNLREAIFYLKKFLKIKALSAVYETEPWGVLDQPHFLNACAIFEDDNNLLNPVELLNKIKEIEQFMGREKNIRWGARKIDIDILFIDNNIFYTPDLKIPHENMYNRDFVIVPLCNVAPDWLHPIINKTPREILKNLKLNKNITPLKITEL